MEIDYSAIGRRIVKKRNQLGQSRQKICQLIDVSEARMVNIESGKSKINLQILSNIAVTLETTLDCLVFGIPDPRDKQITDELYNKIQSLPKDKADFVKILITVLENKEI